MMRKDWKCYKLEEICEFISGLWTGKKPPFVTIGVIRNTNFTKECNLDDSDIAYINVEEKSFLKKQLKKGDIIVEKSGGSDKQPVGRAILFNLEGDFSFSNFTIALRIKDIDLVYPQYLHKGLVAHYMHGETKVMQSNTTGIRNLDITRYKNLLIFVPSLLEQKAIVAELDKLNEILAKKHEQLKELDRLGQAIFYDMFGDPILNDRKWKSCNLSQICDVGSSKRVFVEDLVEKGIPFYRGTEIAVLSLGDKIIPKFYITEEHYNRLKELTGIPVYGDLLLPSICHEGKIWRVNTNEPFYFKDGRVLWIHLNSKDVNGTYLQYMLREKIMKDYINIASGTTFSELKIFALKKVVVILPPIDLQMKFAEQINAIESQKQKIKQSIVEVQQLLDYAMNKYFG
ncbi:restriction endonuclease subunit S [uncultured Parabacteroides sp.]|uniref:restriction endonuclease subunit S n=1 Tax=uncultured Parabacteroides sp. TaxID=512312 RepID=UPI0025935C46|nr:restriction endonuclease subunit S [uncultured Parabacteroides sp.]